ncbi:MAG: biopolymer transporter ExbD [Candidatus Omnitrophota bacterium]|nr:biopolymer transporter ExbD [Candidatus Omnitrophota bacterium]
MRFKRHNKVEHGLTQIDIAPLIDMVFQLLIFFMLTSSFIFQTGIKINLPKAITSEVLQEESKVIVISSENVIYLNDKVVTLKELEKVLRLAAKKNSPLLIKADRRASLGRIVDVWDLCRDVGLSKVNIATNQGQ